MFFNLRAEMARKHINQLEIAVVLGISVKSVSNKMNGKSEFTRKEMFLIKKTFFPECSTDYLFYVDKQVYQKSLFV